MNSTDGESESIEINFGIYGKVDVATLDEEVSNTTAGDGVSVLFYKALLKQLDGVVYEGIRESTRLVDIVNTTVTPDQHKLTLSIWKGLLTWQEGCLYSHLPLITEPLRLTITRYITWTKDTNTLKIAKFMAAGYLKMLKHCDTSPDAMTSQHPMTSSNVSLIYQICRLMSDNVDMSESRLDFLILFRKSLSRSTVFTDAPSSHPHQYYLAWLMSTLDSLSFDNVNTVLTSLSHCSSDIARGLDIVTENKVRVPFVHYTIYKLSGLCTRCSTRAQFQVLEKTLVVNVLSYNTVCSVVGANVVVFLARLGPPGYVTSLVTWLCHVTCRLTCRIRVRNVKHVISRLLPLVEPRDLGTIEPLTFSHTNTKLLDLMSHDHDIKISNMADNILQQWKQDERTSDVLHDVLTAPTTLPLTLLPPLSSQLEVLLQSRGRVNETKNVYNLVLQCLSSIRDNWRLYRDSNTVVQVLQELEKFMPLNDVMISSLILDVLSKFSSYQCSQGGLYSVVVARLWRLLLKDKDTYLSHTAVSHLAAFARMTPHPEILSCLAKDARIKERLSQYFQRVSEKSGECSGDYHYTDSNVTDMRKLTPSILVQSLTNELAALSGIPKHHRKRLAEIVSG